jgi:hypothetical protein
MQAMRTTWARLLGFPRLKRGEWLVVIWETEWSECSEGWLIGATRIIRGNGLRATSLSPGKSLRIGRFEFFDLTRRPGLRQPIGVDVMSSFWLDF